MIIRPLQEIIRDEVFMMTKIDAYVPHLNRGRRARLPSDDKVSEYESG